MGDTFLPQWEFFDIFQSFHILSSAYILVQLGFVNWQAIKLNFRARADMVDLDCNVWYKVDNVCSSTIWKPKKVCFIFCPPVLYNNSGEAMSYRTVIMTNFSQIFLFLAFPIIFYGCVPKILGLKIIQATSVKRFIQLL